MASLSLPLPHDRRERTAVLSFFGALAIVIGGSVMLATFAEYMQGATMMGEDVENVVKGAAWIALGCALRGCP